MVSYLAVCTGLDLQAAVQPLLPAYNYLCDVIQKGTAALLKVGQGLWGFFNTATVSSTHMAGGHSGGEVHHSTFVSSSGPCHCMNSWKR
jgi:hypothetical protein